jgi:HSP20 family protein
VPGVRAEDVDLRFERGELTLHARVKQRQRPDQYFLWEYEDGDFYRVFQVHETIDATRISAECKNGVLTVHLPKAEAAKPRQVQVRGD